MGDAEIQPEADGDPDPACRIRRVAAFRPGTMPGMHELVKVTEKGVGQAITVGEGLPRAIIKHAGHVISPEAVDPIPDPPFPKSVLARVLDTLRPSHPA